MRPRVHAMRTTSYYLGEKPCVHIDNVLVDTIVGRMYTRQGLMVLLKRYGLEWDMVYDNGWIRRVSRAPRCF